MATNEWCKKNFTPSIPHELIVEILLRLPVKSALRFKSVCKSWLSLISDTQFAKSQFDLDATPSHRILLGVGATHDFIVSIDTEASALCDDDSALVYLRLPPSPIPLTDRTAYRLQFWGSCRGFILLRHGVNNLVWNPSTGVHRRIPNSHVMMMNKFLCGFGYDASRDDYLVVFIGLVVPQVMIQCFSLKTNSWDCEYVDVQGSYQEHQGYGFRTSRISRVWDCDENVSVAGSFLNGALHWLVYSGDGEKVNVIIAFDLVERSLSEIPLPTALTDRLNYHRCGLKVIGGCLSVWCSSQGRGEVWMMKEYNVWSSWTRSFHFSDQFRIFTPICLTKDNALLGSDLHRHRLEKLCGETNQWLSDHFTYGKGLDLHSCDMQCALYSESLLSLPG